jgi:hypothetical protein
MQVMFLTFRDITEPILRIFYPKKPKREVMVNRQKEDQDSKKKKEKKTS